MNRVVKRILTVASVAPMVLMVTAAGAQATTDFEYGQLQDGAIVAECYNDNLENFGFAVAMDVDTDGDYADVDDVNDVRVSASNNVSTVGWERSGAQVSSVRVELYRSEFSKIDDHTNQVRPAAFTVTDSTSNFTADGDVTRVAAVDNVGYAVVKVEWSATPDGQGPEVLACTIKLPTFDQVN